MNKELFFEYWMRNGIVVIDKDGWITRYVGQDLWDYTANEIKLEQENKEVSTLENSHAGH